MSRGRSRHQASRRRTYSGRQRELRERKLRLEQDDQPWIGQHLGAPDIEEPVEFDAAASWTSHLSRRANAA